MKRAYMTVELKFKELQIMYTQIKRTNGGEKNNTTRSFTFPHKGGGLYQRLHTPAPTYCKLTHRHWRLHNSRFFKVDSYVREGESTPTNS